MSSELLHVRVGGEQYALPVDAVLEVARLDDVTAVPGAPPAFLGVWALRGRVLPVIDLGTLLGVARDGRPRWLVIAEHGQRIAALAVDGLLDVMPMTGRSEPTEAPLLSRSVLTDSALVGVVAVGPMYDRVQEMASR